MHDGQGSSMHIVRLTSFIVVGTWLGVAVATSQQTSGFSPTIQLEKSIYAADESVRFWVGVTSASQIPEALRSSCVLHWVRPDGTRLDEHVPWPRDGDTSRGWTGGWGFGKQSVSLGRYVISLEFGGQETTDQSFEIVKNPFSSRMSAHWIFVDTKSAGGIHARGAFLRVQNRTDRVVRFAKPGLIGSEVWLDVKTFQPPSMESMFVSQSALLQANEIPSYSFEKQLEWSNQSRWPMITVPPGDSKDRTVDLQSAYPFHGGQEYEVTISTVLTVFIGEREDSGAGLFPLRMPVSATAHFHW
jgi:hypothetical protein